MSRIKTTIALLSMIAVSALTTQAQADEYLHINNLAQLIHDKSSELHKQMKHFRHTPHYDHVRSNALEIKRLANDIRKIAKREGSIVTLAACLDQLATYYHHTAELVDEIDFSVANGVGRVHADASYQVKALMVDLEDCIYQMRQDVAVIQARAYRSASRPVYTPTVTKVVTRNVYIPAKPRYVPKYVPAKKYVPTKKGYAGTKAFKSGRGQVRGQSRSRGGITVGGGNFRVQFKF